MKRRTRFLIGMVAAALTFGTLMATVGPRHFNHHGGRCHNMENCNGNNETSKHHNRIWDDKGDDKSSAQEQNNKQQNN